MFEITPDDIALLADEDLRTLIGRLCESEMRRQGLSPLAVTWGGHPNSADGGLDVRVALPSGAAIDGSVPRPNTGFQVKKPDMPRAEILDEMRPNGILRPVIQQLADQSGAYIIVSSSRSTSDSALQNRRKAMAEAVKQLPNAGALTLDFYDRNRIATWVRDHPGLIPWVRERIGRRIQGWQSYGPWAYPAGGEKDQYLLDEEIRIRKGGEPPLKALEGLKRVRDRLSVAASVVRLVGLSGVGKTRFVQALFDERVGGECLDPSLAAYTNIADDPDPSPTVVASNLIAARQRMILIIDNCAPDLHRRLSELCRSPESSISLISVEYDVREDQPEGTEVLFLEPASIDLIVKLLGHRFPSLSPIDARTIADFSDGNARIAISLAQTVGNETIAGLSDEDLFRRLFEQRHAPDESLLLAAQALSLVYSFDGNDLSEGAELYRLGALIGKSAEDMYRNAAEIEGRDLIQRRSIWRAVLPHGIANRLAAMGLKRIPLTRIETELINGAPERLLRSFARRLGYLHASNEAQAIAGRWLSPGGLLGNATNLNELGWAMFNHVAPVVPETTLSALERAFSTCADSGATQNCHRFVPLICSLAYDASLFQRCVTLLMEMAAAEQGKDERNQASKALPSLFTLYFSGTWATIEQRLTVIESLLVSNNSKQRELGLAALRGVLEAWHFSSAFTFEFGARSRDYGYLPKTRDDEQHWFASALKLAEAIGSSEKPVAPQVCTVIAEQFRGLWTGAAMYDELERSCSALSAKRFWTDGWIAVRQTIHFDSKGFSAEVSARLDSLEELLRPQDLLQKVRSVVLSEKIAIGGLDSEDDKANDIQKTMDRIEEASRTLGNSVAADRHAFAELLPELVTRDGQLWSFGRGLAEGSDHPEQTWSRLVAQLAATAENHRKFAILGGFLNASKGKYPELVGTFLDDAITNDTLAMCYPWLQVATGIDERGWDRLMCSLEIDKIPVSSYLVLRIGRATDPIPGAALKALLLRIAAKPHGLDVALDILYIRIHSALSQRQEVDSDIVAAGQQLMSQLTFEGTDYRGDHRFDLLSGYCLIGETGAAIVEAICRNLKQAIATYKTYAFHHDELADSLFSAQPIAALDGFCSGDIKELNIGVHILNEISDRRRNPLDRVPLNDLLNWCELQPEIRYPAAAAVVTIAKPSGDSSEPQLSDIALRLFDNARDRLAVLKRITARFSPRSWSGSRAAIIGANAELLDHFAQHPDAVVREFVATEKARFAEAIVAERQLERGFQLERDERFE